MDDQASPDACIGSRGFLDQGLGISHPQLQAILLCAELCCCLQDSTLRTVTQTSAIHVVSVIPASELGCCLQDIILLTDDQASPDACIGPRGFLDLSSPAPSHATLI